MNIKNEQIRQVLALLGSPEMVNNSHELAIRTFIAEYPYVQPAYYLLAKATLHHDSHNDDKSLAATYCPNGEALYRTIFQPYKFSKIDSSQFVSLSKDLLSSASSPWKSWTQNTSISPSDFQNIDEILISENHQMEMPIETILEPSIEEVSLDTVHNEEDSVISSQLPDMHTAHQPKEFDIQEAITASELEPIQQKSEEAIFVDTPTAEMFVADDSVPTTEESVANHQHVEPSIIMEAAAAATLTLESTSSGSHQVDLPFEIETFDHIDTAYSTYFTTPVEEVEISVESISESNEQQPELAATQSTTVLGQDQTTLVATTNAVEQSIDTALEEETETPLPEEFIIAAQNVETLAVLPQDELAVDTAKAASISKYDDDAMPYSFLWWLQKTRQDYYDSCQPFSKNTALSEFGNDIKPTSAMYENIETKAHQSNPLENQYKEHIFNLQAPFNIDDHLASDKAAPVKTRMDELIDRFIKNDPQISAPEPNKLDNENKARLSTNENSELVTETLAKIYVEQMLYHKAIMTYQKLSLKFPEKSRYFAELVAHLQEKINK